MKQGRYVTTKSGKCFHRPGCVEVDEYKAPTGTRTVSSSDISKHSLRPCQICKPVVLKAVE